MRGIPIGHISSNFDQQKKKFSFLQVLQFVKGASSKLNAIKSHLQASLKLDSLDHALMRVSLNMIEA